MQSLKSERAKKEYEQFVKEVTPTIFAMTSSGCLKAAELIRWRIKRRQGSSPGWVWTTKVSFI